MQLKIALTRPALTLIGASVATVLVALLLTLLVPWQASTGIEAGSDRDHYSMPWTSNSPFYPSEWETPGDKLVNWRSVPSATYCAECHKKEYREWASSIHAITGPDIVYEGTILENEFESEHGGDTATEKIRWCDGCHEPLGILAGEGSPLTAVGPNEALEEGASCILCHTAVEARPLIGNGGLTLNINEIKRYIDPALIMAAPSQHAVSMQAKTHNPLMGKSDLCGTCHTEIRPTRISGDFPLHMQETFDEWRLSDYAEQGIHCQDCHMDDNPAEYVNALKAGKVPERQISHRFVGNNYLLTDSDLPDNMVVQLRGGWVPGRNVFMTGEEWLADLKKQQGLIIDLLKSAADMEVQPKPLLSDGKAGLDVVITNSGAGHYLPTGALDQRYMWVEVKVTDATGESVYHNGWFDAEKGEEDPAAVKYIKMLWDEDGERIDRHILFDVERMNYARHPIRPKESDRISYNFPVPTNAQGALKVEVRLWYRLALQPILRNIEKQIVPAPDLDGVVIPPVLMLESTTEIPLQPQLASRGDS